MEVVCGFFVDVRVATSEGPCATITRVRSPGNSTRWTGPETLPQSAHHDSQRGQSFLAAAPDDRALQGCEVVEAMPASAYVTQGWADYGNYLLENSPAMDHVVNQHPLWWGHLSSIRWGRK